MKKRLLSLTLALILLLSLAIPALAAENAGAAPVSAGFHYRHDPRLNPKAMADIVVDPTAIYGFRPSETGSLKQFVDYDWSDAEAAEAARQDRLAYHESIEDMYRILDEMTAEGKGTEEIARAVSARRNELRMESYLNDPDELARIKARNLEKYGHEEGPTPDELYAQYGSWQTVLEKAFSANSGMDACLGLYDDYYELYVSAGQIPPEEEQSATREYATAAFADAAGVVPGDGPALSDFRDGGSVSPWYAPELSAAVSAGVVVGYEDGTLRPNQPIRRVEALVLLSRCLPDLPRVREPIPFADVPDWARADVDRLSAAGLVEGCGDGTLGADDPLTVAQVGLLTARLQAGE